MASRWRVRVSGPASRKISDALPEPVATAIVEFITGALIEDPHRVGKPLQQELTGLHVARRGTFRVIYEIHDDDHIIDVIDVGHRGDIYRPRDR